jgi:phosphatidylserine/phosphatidylglycerophosphate/cardiolipin synthase-like enzyme
MPVVHRLLVPLVLIGLTVPLTQPVAAAAERRWAPPEGVVMSDPMIPSAQRAILKRVNRAIRNTAKGEFIRIAVWNYDDRATARSLVDAHRRGVHVQIVVASSVQNPNWDWTRRVLNRNKRDRSFAVRCRGACRSAGKIMHSKFVLISRVHRVHNISMVGSYNITRAAGNRQWNDLVTVHNQWLYRSLRGTFREYARDQPVASPFQVSSFGRHKVTLWPSYRRNTIRAELRHVSCKVPAGDGYRRTKVRIAIAGWFDAFGYDIARKVRRLWDRGCNIRIITTLAGRGVNRVLRNPRGRGPVPIRQVTVDNDLDGIPERYLHMKAVAIRGGFAGDSTANVLITGSPNWSSRASRSDEIVFRFLSSKRLVGQYFGHIDRLYRGPWSHTRTDLDPVLARRVVSGDLPEWFELD